jgi:hypothetical protein
MVTSKQHKFLKNFIQEFILCQCYRAVLETRVLLHALIIMISIHYLFHISSWSLQCQIEYAYMIGLHFCAVPGLQLLVPGMDFWHQMA